MKKSLILALAAMVASFVLSCTSYSFTKANVIEAIKKEFADGGDLMAIKIVLLNVSDVQTGIMQQRSNTILMIIPPESHRNCHMRQKLNTIASEETTIK